MVPLPVILLISLYPINGGGLTDCYYQYYCRKGYHVMCEFREPGPGERCVNYTKVMFDQNLRNDIVTFINSHRQLVAAGQMKVKDDLYLPKPKLMNLVTWDKELATIAQRWADQCQFSHDTCRSTAKYRFTGQTIGEVRFKNMSLVTIGKHSIIKVFETWWAEAVNVLPEEIVGPFKIVVGNPVYGDFSQLIIWNLSAVGCGAVGHGIKLLLVCDYSHTNMLSENTYTAGDLAPCPFGMARVDGDYPLLCGAVNTIVHPTVTPKTVFDRFGGLYLKKSKLNTHLPPTLVNDHLEQIYDDTGFTVEKFKFEKIQHVYPKNKNVKT